MIAFKEAVPLEKLIGRISEANLQIPRRDDQIRMFQVSMERLVQMPVSDTPH